MKMQLSMALAAALVIAPCAVSWAADFDSPAAAEKTEKPKIKKKVSSKQPKYNAIGAAKKITAQTQEPIVAFFCPADNPMAIFFKKKVLTRKEFVEFVKKNCVCYMPNLSKSAKDPKKLDLKKMKAPDREFLEKFGVDPKQVEAAKAIGHPEPTAEDLVNYPSVVVVDAEGEKLLFRMPKVDVEGGFGVWILELSDRMRDAGIELEIPPSVKTILANPMAEANAAAAKGGKKKK